MDTGGSNAERLARAIEDLQPSVILVDYFETLVTRSITGKQIKRVTARFIRERFDLDATVDEIHRVRLDVEADLRRAAHTTGLDPEHRMDDLADGMWHHLGRRTTDGRPIDRATFCDAALAIELSVERAAQTPDTDVIAVLRSVADRHRLVVVSDFHLPTPWFGEMLTHHGIDDLFDEVYVSGDHGLSKATGRLYDHVLAALPSDGEPTMLMVGDHPISDGEQASARGLATCLIRRPPAPAPPNRIQRRWTATRTARRRRLRAIVADQPEGFGELAVTLYAFTRSLHREADRQGIRQLEFLAREGRILHTLFTQYAATAPAAAGRPIAAHYLIVSRRSTYLPALRPIDDEDFARLVELYPSLTTADLLANLGIDAEGNRAVLDELDAAPDQPVDIGKLRASPTFRRLYTETRATQGDLLRRLISDLVGDDSPLTVVDVGWKGTMQDHLARIVGQTRDVSGFYLGIVPGRYMLPDGRKAGLLFDGRTEPTPAERTLRHFKSLYEFLLQADHGSARRYVERDGRVEAELDDQEAEAEVFTRHIGPVQDQIATLFRQLCTADALSDLPLIETLEDVARIHERMLYFPTRSEIARIRAIRHYENFGPLGFVGADGTDEPGALDRLRRAGTLMRRPGRIVASGWPPLTLTEAGLGRLTPLIGAYRWIRARSSSVTTGGNRG